MVKMANNSNSLAASFGGSLGGGISEALVKVLNGIAQNKVSELENRQQFSQQQQENPTMQALGLIGGQPQQQYQGLNPQMLDSLREAQSSPLQGALGSLAPQQQEQPQDQQQQSMQKPQAPQAPKPVKPTSFPKDSSKLSAKQVDKILNAAGPKTPQSVKKVEAIAEENPDPVKHAKVVEKQDKQIKKMPQLSEKQQLAADKETKGFFDEIHKASKAAKEGNLRLDRMVELIKEGRLTWPSVSSFLDTVEKGIPLWESNLGLDLHWLENTDSQEFRKLSNDFIKNAKDIFGARVTNQDLLSFMKTVPTLSQSDTGKIRVIRNLRLMNEIALVKKNAMDEILDENGGQRPPNLERLVEKRTEDQVEALSDKFRKGIMTKDEAEALAVSQDRKLLGIF